MSVAALRPGKHSGGHVHGGAIAGVREIAFYCATSRNEYTGMKYRSRRSHQGRMRGRSCPEVAGVLEMADGGGAVELQARCDVSEAPLTPGRSWMEAERCAASTYIARRSFN
jgi:hypothetical protein